jgi:hypothetical protein
MARIVPTEGSMYGVMYNNGKMMMCVNPDYGVWQSTREIALEVLNQIVDETETPKALVPKNKTPSESAMRRWRSNRVRMERARRSNARWSRRHGRSMY